MDIGNGSLTEMVSQLGGAVNNIDKYEIENKICSIETYPEEMINEKI